MKRGQSKWTTAEIEKMVDIYLEECKGESGQGYPTRQGFCSRWHISIQTLENWDRDDNHKEKSEAIAKIGVECGKFWERKVLEEPKLSQFAMFMLKQPCYGGYKDKPDQNINVSIQAKGARINWGK